jgi:hypothetical protein
LKIIVRVRKKKYLDASRAPVVVVAAAAVFVVVDPVVVVQVMPVVVAALSFELSSLVTVVDVTVGHG